MNLIEKPYLRSIEIKRTLIDSIDRYPFCIPSIKKLIAIDFHQDVTFFIGENGSGKSTLLEAVAVALGFNPEGGNKNTNFSTNQNHSDLSNYLKLVKSFKKPTDGYFLRAESFYNLATYMEQDGRSAYLGSYGGKSLHRQSHGESFMATLLNKMKGNGLYLMDEPEAALSPTRQMAALSAIHQLVERKSQFIIATHSPILLAYPRAKIYNFSNIGINEVKYTETEHYEVTRDFLNNPEAMLEILMSN